MNIKKFKKFMVFLPLFLAYNPYTTYVFNNTGFYGASTHQVLMFCGVIAFLTWYAKKTYKVMKGVYIYSLLLLCIFASFASLISRHSAGFNLIVADFIFLFEFFFFWVIGAISKQILEKEDLFKIIFSIFFLNGAALIVMFWMFPTSLYFTLQFGPLRVSRAIDFLIPSSLVFYFVLKDHLKVNPLTKTLSFLVFALANFVGFSRGAWLALAATYVFYLVCRLSVGVTVLSGKKLLRVSALIVVTLLAFHFLGLLDMLLERVLDFDQKSSSVGGRFDSYRDMLTYTFSNMDVLVFGAGLGSNVPGMEVPASSSPSFFISFLYMNGLPFSLIFFSVYFYLGYLHFMDFKRHSDVYSALALLNLFCHFIILNIFPSVSHYPIFGYLAFISSITIKTRHRA